MAISDKQSIIQWLTAFFERLERNFPSRSKQTLGERSPEKSVSDQPVGTVQPTISLVLHWLGIGDIVVCGAIVRGLASQFPDYQVEFYLHANRVFDVHRFIDWAQLVWPHCYITNDGVVPGRKLEIGRPGDADSDPERQGIKGLRHDLWAGMCGTKAIDYTITPDRESLYSAQAMLKDMGLDLDKPIAYLSPVTANRWRNWPIEKWLVVEANLREHGVQVLIGALKPEPWAPQEQLAKFKSPYFIGKHSPPVLLGILHLTDVIVSNDSGFAHLGGVLDKPTVAVCGGNYDGHAVFGFYRSVEVVQANSRLIDDVSTGRVLDTVMPKLKTRNSETG
ncbi:MAG TPA: glycosyltransferase family 9 protein [Anaerolineales bacterium]|nr:glycosyltransferase family 9 protein [Anaerolineales bacterium]